jgi:hypothetical protein
MDQEADLEYLKKRGKELIPHFTFRKDPYRQAERSR